MEGRIFPCCAAAVPGKGRGGFTGIKLPAAPGEEIPFSYRDFQIYLVKIFYVPVIY